MPRFKVVTPKGASFSVAGGGYGFEMEALTRSTPKSSRGRPMRTNSSPPPGRRRDLRQGHAVHEEDGRRAESCKVIVLGSVGVDSVDVKAATARGLPVTNCPHTFIEEVADHAMMLLLSRFGASSSRIGWCARDAGARDGRSC